MLLEQILLPGVIVPALLAGTVHLLARFVLRTDRRDDSQREVVGSTALALGYLAAHVGISGWPPLPAVESTDWLFHAVVVAALATPMLVALGDRPALTFGLRLPLFAALLWLSLGSVIEYRWSTLQTVIGLASLLVVMLALAWVLERLGEQSAPHLPAALGILVFGATALVLGLSASARLAQLCGAGSAALAAGWLLWPVTRQAPLSGRAATVATLVLGGLLLNGHFYAELRWWNALLVLAAPVAALLMASRPSGRVNSPILVLGACLLPLSLAVGLAAWQARQVPDDPYDYGATIPEVEEDETALLAFCGDCPFDSDLLDSGPLDSGPLSSGPRLPAAGR